MKTLIRIPLNVKSYYSNGIRWLAGKITLLSNSLSYKKKLNQNVSNKYNNNEKSMFDAITIAKCPIISLPHPQMRSKSSIFSHKMSGAFCKGR